MKKIEIYDPAMCCSTGVCGPSINQELLRVATVIDTLTKNGANITRYNLSSEPQAFITNVEVNRLLKEDNDILPITFVNDQIVKIKTYLTNEEFSQITGMIIVNQPQETNQSCSCGDNQEDCCSDDDDSQGDCCGGNQDGCC